MTTVSFCPLNALLPSPVIPLSSYPAIRYTIRGRHPSSFISRTPRSRTACYSPRFLLTHIAGRASLIFPISALLCACALVLTLYLYLFFTEPPPPLLPLFLRALLPIPTLTEPPTLTAPTVPPAHYSRSRPRYARFFFPSVSYLNIFSLSITLRRGSICSLLDMPVSTLYSLRFPPSVPLSRSYLISVLIDCWVITTYIYLYLILISFSYLYFCLCLCLCSLFPVPVFVLFCLPHFFILFTPLFYCRSHGFVGVEKQKKLPQARACTGAPELDLRGRFTDIPFRFIIPVAVISAFLRDILISIPI